MVTYLSSMTGQLKLRQFMMPPTSGKTKGDDADDDDQKKNRKNVEIRVKRKSYSDIPCS